MRVIAEKVIRDAWGEGITLCVTDAAGRVIFRRGIRPASYEFLREEFVNELIRAHPELEPQREEILQQVHNICNSFQQLTLWRDTR